MFLVCRFDDYDNYRNLALHRIQVARDTGLPFERPADFDLKAYDDNGGFDYGGGEFIRMSLWVSAYLALLLAETPLSFDQTLMRMAEPHPKKASEARVGARLDATVVQSALLVRWLRSHGAGANSGALDKGVLLFAASAKYAVAFPRVSRSIVNRASFARCLEISICSMLPELLSAPVRQSDSGWRRADRRTGAVHVLRHFSSVTPPARGAAESTDDLLC